MLFESDVINHVWDMANEIINQIEDGFYMFLTDCFFVHPAFVDDAKQLLKKYKYETKTNNYKLINIEPKYEFIEKVSWIEKTEKALLKYHLFNENINSYVRI